MTTTTPEATPAALVRRPNDQALIQAPITQVIPDPANPREDVGDVTELADSMEEIGLLQPIVARREGARMIVVAGHRRLAAAQQLGWRTVPVIIRREMLPDDVLAAMLIENGQRRDLDPIEEARALRRAFDVTGLPSLDEQMPDVEAPAAPAVSLADFGKKPAADPVSDVIDAEEVSDETPKLNARQKGKLFALFNQKGIPEDQQRPGIEHIIGRKIQHRDELSLAEFEQVLAQLEASPDAESSPEPLPVGE